MVGEAASFGVNVKPTGFCLVRQSDALMVQGMRSGILPWRSVIEKRTIALAARMAKLGPSEFDSRERKTKQVLTFGLPSHQLTWNLTAPLRGTWSKPPPECKLSEPHSQHKPKAAREAKGHLTKGAGMCPR